MISKEQIRISCSCHGFYHRLTLGNFIFVVCTHGNYSCIEMDDKGQKRYGEDDKEPHAGDCGALVGPAEDREDQ